MKYLKKFNESSITDDNNLDNIFYLLLPLIDNFNLEIKYSNNSRIIYSNTNIQLEINKNQWILDQYCYSIKVQTKINKQYGTDIYHITDTEFAEALNDVIESSKEILGAEEILM